jgi:hypothetical protein
MDVSGMGIHAEKELFLSLGLISGIRKLRKTSSEIIATPESFALLAGRFYAFGSAS